MMRLTGLAFLVVCFMSSAPDFVSKGEVQFTDKGRAGSAAFNDTAVVGPLIQMNKEPDGAWRGHFAGQSIELRATETEIRGNLGTYLKINRKDNMTFVDGTFAFHRVRIELHKAGEVIYRESGVGLGNPFTLKGQAADAQPPMLQFVLAVLAAAAAH